MARFHGMNSRNTCRHDTVKILVSQNKYRIVILLSILQGRANCFSISLTNFWLVGSVMELKLTTLAPSLAITYL